MGPRKLSRLMSHGSEESRLGLKRRTSPKPSTWPSAPNFLMELHVGLVAAVPNGQYVEHIPQLRSVTRSEIEVRDGHAVAPDAPGIGIDWNTDAIDDRRIA